MLHWLRTYWLDVSLVGGRAGCMVVSLASRFSVICCGLAVWSAGDSTGWALASHLTDKSRLHINVKLFHIELEVPLRKGEVDAF